jgi:hypothetical protein
LFTAYKEVASAQGGLTPLLYLDPGAWSSPGITPDLAAPPKPQDYETFETLLVGVHGQPDSWKALSMDSPALRGLNLRPLSVLTYSCCSLCYKYTLQGKTQHKPFLGVAFIRAGAMGFLGSISSASYVHERDNLYLPIKSFIADKKTLGLLITLPLAGTTEQAWRTLFLDRYLGYYSILGDPTYKPRLSAPAANPPAEPSPEIPIPRVRP